MDFGIIRSVILILHPVTLGQWLYLDYRSHDAPVKNPWHRWAPSSEGAHFGSFVQLVPVQ